MTARQLPLPESPSVMSAVTPRYPRKHLPAHDCVRLGVCYWCGAPCKVVRLGVGHITVPWCGCDILGRNGFDAGKGQAAPGGAVGHDESVAVHCA